jgi:hypothetical protein
LRCGAGAAAASAAAIAAAAPAAAAAAAPDDTDTGAGAGGLATTDGAERFLRLWVGLLEEERGVKAESTAPFWRCRRLIGAPWRVVVEEEGEEEGEEEEEGGAGWGGVTEDQLAVDLGWPPDWPPDEGALPMMSLTRGASGCKDTTEAEETTTGRKK